MTYPEYYAVFPDGDTQELDGPLRIDALVDLNARPLELPLSTERMIAYRVAKIRRQEGRGEEATYHYLELVPTAELRAYLI
jgi:hypothetical protein